MEISNLKIDKSKWKPVKFGDIVAEPKEVCKDVIAEGIEHVVGLEHIDAGDLHLRNSASIEDSTTFSKKFKKGDVLFGRRRAYLKKAAQAEFEGICSGDITVFRAKKDKLIPELLPFVVNNDKFFDYAIKHSAGGLSPRVKFKDLANYEFLLPPREEQAKLAELLCALDEVIEKEKNTLKSLELNYSTVIKSIFDFTSERIKLEEIQFDYFKGISAEESDNNNAYLIPSGGVFPRFLKGDKLKKVNISYEVNFSKLLMKGDVLFNTGGVGTLGRSHYFEIEVDNYYCDSFVLVLRFIDKNFLNKYIYHVFQSKSILNQINQHTKGTTGITSISIEGINKFKIPNIQLKEQKWFVKKLDEINNLIFDYESQIQNSLSLQKSLINKIF